MDKKRKEIIFGILFLGILVFVGLDSCLYSLRLDVTANGMFSLSPVSRTLFRDIPEQVRLTYYLTEKLKTTDTIYQSIEDILREYAAASHGKIKLDIYDPVRDNKLQEIEEFGIQQFPAGRQDAEDEASIIQDASSGIVIQYLGRSPRVIRLIRSVDTLEYDLTSNIRSLVADRVKKIGYLVDVEQFSYQDFSYVQADLQQYFNLEEVQKGADIPQNLDALFVIGGTSLTEFELYPIDQYLMRGGKVVFAADPVKIFSHPQVGVMGNAMEKVPLFDLLKTYGVAIPPELVMEHPDLSLAPQGPGTQRYNYYFTTYQDYLSKDSPITSRMRPVYFFWASPLVLSPPAGVKAETLISTSPTATTAKGEFKLNLQDARMMYAINSSQEKASYPLLAALSGNFPSFFKDKPIPKKEGVKNDWTKTETMSAAARLIVAGDSELFSPVYIAQGARSNFELLFKCLTWLAADEDLLAIRSRAQRDLLMMKIPDPEARKTATTLVIVLNLAGIPVLVIGFGLLNFFLRRRKQKGRG